MIPDVKLVGETLQTGPGVSSLVTPAHSIEIKPSFKDGSTTPILPQVNFEVTQNASLSGQWNDHFPNLSQEAVQG